MLENQTAEKSTERVVNALNSTITQIKLLCADYAGWDDTYTFIKDKNTKYITTNLVDETFSSTKLDLILYINKAGQLIYGKAYDYRNNKPAELPSDVSTLIGLNKTIINKGDPVQGLSGLINIDSGPLLIAAYPIVTSQKEGPIEGTLIMARRLDNNQRNELAQITDLNISFEKITDIPSQDSQKVIVTTLNDETNKGTLILNDIFGKPAVQLDVILGREITTQLNHAIIYILTALIIVGFINLLIGFLLARNYLLRPLRRLVDEVRQIAQTGKFSSNIHISGRDEIGDLARDVNSMIGSLELNSRSLIELNKELKKQRDSIEEEVDKRTHQLKEEQARFMSSINSFPEAFIVTDTDGNVLLTNNALNKTLDLQHQEWTIEELEKIFENYFDIRRNITLCQKERKPLLLSGIAYKKRFLKVYMAPIIFGEGKIIGTVILLDDITEAVLTERSKDEFLLIASHELRTPLTAIKGNSELLTSFFADKVNDSNFKEIISDIQKACVSLIEIVNAFLTTSRLEQDRLEFNREPISVEKLIVEVAYKYRTISEQKGVQLLVSNLASPNLKVMGDRQRIEEVLTNLIGNAIKYTDKGSIKIVVDKKDEFAKISVIDTGRGIPLKQQSLLFKKFQQASNNIYTRDVTHGTGLGLYIAKLMTEAMGGEIYLEKSAENQGSIFAFTLPLSNN